MVRQGSTGDFYTDPIRVFFSDSETYNISLVEPSRTTFIVTSNIGFQNTGWPKPEFVSDVMIILEFQVTLGGIIASLFIVAYSLVHKKTLIISTMSGSKAPWRPS